MSQPIRAVERALNVLLCFSRQTPELTLTEISKKVDIHKSTVHRILTTLEEKHFVERDKSTGAYRLGINILQMVYLDVIESPQRVKLAAAIGQRLPAFCTASGKAILAFSPPEVLQKVIEHGMHQYTQYTLDSHEEFQENIEQTRKRGFAISMEEYEEEINAIAVPILDQDNLPIASIAIAGPSYRLTQEKMLEIGYDLLLIVREIEKAVKISTNT